MPLTLLGITRDELDLATLVRLVADNSDQPPGRHGAVVTFLGTVRGESLGRRVVELEYQAYEPLAVRAFEFIAAEVADAWPGVRLALHHRIGTLRPGQVSVAIAAASPHRAEGFQACRYALERVKQIAPIWKREIFEGGEAWIEGATADPSDSAARQAARERACR
jgi:molybdopterin synthase catalytic subunit